MVIVDGKSILLDEHYAAVIGAKEGSVSLLRNYYKVCILFLWIILFQMSLFFPKGYCGVICIYFISPETLKWLYCWSAFPYYDINS